MAAVQAALQGDRGLARSVPPGPIHTPRTSWPSTNQSCASTGARGPWALSYPTCTSVSFLQGTEHAHVSSGVWPAALGNSLVFDEYL